MASTFTTRKSLEKQGTGDNENTWGTTLNTVLDNIDKALAGVLPKSVAGSSDVTLTTDEAREPIQKYTGELTGNINVIVPTLEGWYLVSNETTGSFTLTVKTSSGTGVAVTQGDKAFVYCDGTNVVKFWATDDALTTSGDQTITSTDAGATAGPILNLDRNSASPADNDVLGAVAFKGRDDGGGTDTFAQIQAEITDASAATEDGILNFLTKTAGAALASAMKLGAGLFLGGQTDPGAGKINATGLQVAGTDVMVTGKHTIWVPASAMRPTVSNGCAQLTSVETTAGRPDMNVLDFDASADEHAQFEISLPKSYNGSTLTFRVHHTTTATDTDGVAWGLQAVHVGDGDTIDVAYGTAVVVTDTYQSTAEDEYVTAESDAMTPAGTWATGDRTIFRIFRDVSDAADTASEDARLLGVEIFITLNAGNDA